MTSGDIMFISNSVKRYNNISEFDIGHTHKHAYMNHAITKKTIAQNCETSGFHSGEELN
jgi:hypothetical protein